MRAVVTCESSAAAYYDPYSVEYPSRFIPHAAYLKLSAVANEGGGLTLFALNHDVEQEMTVSVNARGFGRLALAEATVLTDSDLKAANTKAAPFRVKSRRGSAAASWAPRRSGWSCRPRPGASSI